MDASFLLNELPVLLVAIVLIFSFSLFFLYLRKRRQNQRLIESNRDLLRSINRNISEGLYRTTVDGKFLYINNAFAQMFGYESPERMMQVNAAILYKQPEKRKELQDMIARMGRFENHEVEFVTRDGHVFWALVSTIGVKDEYGDIQYYDGVVNDISRYKEALGQLHESETRYRYLIDTMSEALLYVDNNDELRFANQRFYDMVGYTPEELQGQPLMNILVNPEDRELVKEKNQLRTQRISDSYEIRFIHKNGKNIWVRISGRYLEDANKNVIGSLGTISDVTKLKEADAELRASEEKFTAFMNNIPALAWIKDHEGRYVFMNTLYLDTYHLKREDVIGKKTPDVFPKEMQSISLEEGDRTVLEEGKKFETIEKNATPDHEDHYWLVNRFPINIREHEDYLGGIAFNVTSLIEARNGLELSLKEKEVLLSEIHHRVKNNLQIISSLLNLQARQIKDKDMVRFFLESQNRVRSMALIHEKLYQSSDFVQIDFADYTRSICNQLYKSYVVDPGRIQLNLQAENIRIDIELAVPLGLIVTELTSNAFKYAFNNRDNGNITITLRYDDDNWLVVIVQDDGVGLPDNFNIQESNSLGLQLVCSLVEQLRGEIEHSSNSSGTKFIVVVPQTYGSKHE